MTAKTVYARLNGYRTPAYAVHYTAATTARNTKAYGVVSQNENGKWIATCYGKGQGVGQGRPTGQEFPPAATRAAAAKAMLVALEIVP